MVNDRLARNWETDMKFSKLVLAIAMLGIAAATYTTAQGIRQTTSNVSKAKTSSKVEKNAESQDYEWRCGGGGAFVSAVRDSRMCNSCSSKSSKVEPTQQ